MTPLDLDERGDASIVELADACKTYFVEPPVHALRPTTLQIARGDFVAVTGPSGSGKSTLLNLLGLLDSPSEGRLSFNGLDVHDLGDRRRTAIRAEMIGFVFQSFHLLPHKSALENVLVGLTIAGTRRNERRERATAMLERVGLSGRIRAFPGTMSGGERQRVAIARAAAKSPALLLCDEPTGNLDSKTAGGVLDLLADMNKTGIAVVIITHDPTVASRARRQVSVEDGFVRELSRTEV